MLLIDGSRIYHQIYPLEIEIFGPTFSSEDSCSIAAFQHSMDSNAFYLDMGDKSDFLVSDSFRWHRGCKYTSGRLGAWPALKRNYDKS